MALKKVNEMLIYCQIKFFRDKTFFGPQGGDSV